VFAEFAYWYQAQKVYQILQCRWLMPLAPSRPVRGRTFVWRDRQGDEMNLCADALWRLARQGATEAA
jgi:hypothetical protein